MLPHLRKSRQAQAVTNLLNIGYEPQSALRTLGSWRRAQSRKTGIRAAAVEEYFDLGEILQGDPSRQHLYVSFHYGFYPGIYRALAGLSKSNTVIAIIGDQPSEHELRLKTAAAVEGFQIEFVCSGPRMIKDVRAAIKNSVSAVLLVDVPWSKSGTQLDAMFKTSFGAFTSRTALERLILLLDPEPLCLFSSEVNGRFTLEVRKWSGLSTAFDALGALLIAGASQYERLDSMHKYVRFDRQAKSLVCFDVGEQHYAYGGIAEKFWRVPDQLFLSATSSTGYSIDPSLLKLASTAFRQEFDVVLSI